MSVSVTVKNPTGVPLPLSNVHLLWAFKSASDKSGDENWHESEKNLGRDNNGLVETCVLQQLLFEPNSTQQLVLSVIPHQLGELHLLGVAFRINYPTLSVEGAATPSSPLVSGPMSPTISNLSVQGKQV